ncbi:hypothetical protein ULMS_24180 [Patiriisocius marinistellae]|uniref:Uncharacterized protein n=2 Tax=Patiriisocius marinistellae TaxID=2494560 RepID=A0A5J4FXD4_9FLAO|nr:hypothetical protein ULMS_24180 [Patiriisocius marinistellae]
MVSSLVACKSDDDAGGDGAAADGTLTATVSGAGFTSNAAATTAVIQSAGGTQSLLITANDLGGKNITLTVSGGYEGVGTYNIGGDNMVFVTGSYIEVNPSNPQDAQTWSAPYADSGIAGELNITEVSDTAVKGTFFFDGKNNNDDSIKNITSGSFSINL